MTTQNRETSVAFFVRSFLKDVAEATDLLRASMRIYEILLLSFWVVRRRLLWFNRVASFLKDKKKTIYEYIETYSRRCYRPVRFLKV